MAEGPVEPPYEEMYPTNHLFILSLGNPIRRLCVAIGTSKAFDTFILLAIAVNCIMMAMSAPMPKDDRSGLNDQIESLEIYLLGIFICESLFKIVTQGFLLHPYAYLRSGWNVLDFTVVVTGIMGLPQIGMNAGPMKVIKAARVLRPLKLVSNVPSLQVVMSAIIKSMASLLQICLLIGFVIVIYAIVGLSFLIGKFHFTCFNITNPDALPKPEKYIVEPGFLCGDRPCPEGTVCEEYWEGPNFGITNYDNILSACLTIFTCITCEGWTDTMYWTFDVFDYKANFSWMFYWSLNVIGAQFMLNLVCGVLSGEFSKEKERRENRDEFLIQLANERAAEAGEEWQEAAEQAALKEAEEQLKKSQEEEVEGGGESEPPAMSGAQKMSLKIEGLRATLKPFMLSKFMFWFVMSMVFLNSFFTAIQHYRQPQWITDISAITDNLFLVIFVSEMSIKMFAVTPTEYFKSKFNKFDFCVVVLGLCNLGLSKGAGVNLGIPVLRQLRLMRLFKFTKYYGAMKNLAASIINSMASILSLLVLLFLFLMIFALLGMQLFGGAFYERDGNPASRTNFNDFFNAMLAVFQIITGEDWNFVMYEGIVAYGGPRTGTGLAVSLYFVAVTVLGNYVLLNVFLAIAVDNISLDDAEESDIAAEEVARDEHMAEVKDKYSANGSVANGTAPAGEEEESYGVELEPGQVMGEFDSAPTEGGHAKPGDNMLENLKNPGRMTGNLQPETGMILENNLFICFPGSPIRKIVHPIVTSPHFDNFILALILISSGLLAAEDTTNPEAGINIILTFTDYFFTAVFALEVFLKIINYGFCLHANSYCRDAWNVADMFVVTCAITSLVLSQDKNASATVKSIVKILRILRVLRPLKSINKLPKLKAVFECMIFSLQNVFNIIIITLQFLLIFSMMGVQLFAGKLFYCNDESKLTEDDCQGSYVTFEDDNYNRPIQVEREWSRMDFNFDNCFHSAIALFTSSTGEGWPAVMQTGIDSRELNQGPITNNKIYISIFFIIFVIIFSFFFINVFVGMIILTFQGLAVDPNAELDRNTKGSFEFAMASKPMERFMPEDVKSWQYKAWALIETTFWELLISALIAGNTVVLMLEFHDQPVLYSDILGQINDVFTFVFTFEFSLKMFALGCNYFKDGWNNFDMLIVAGSALDFAIKKVLPPGTIDFDPSIFRLFRALRLVKLLRRSRSLRILLWTFLKSFKALPYVGMLIFLLFFVYGIVGTQVFSLISIENEDEPWAQINRNNHFRSYFSSTQVLFRVATGENWPNIMLACTGKAVCDRALLAVEPQMEYCGSDIAYLYFLSFVFFCSFLMLNLFVAVIMDNFAFLTEDSSILGPHHLDEFITVWSDFDPRATGRIQHTEVCELLRQMLPPVGLGLKCPKSVAYKRLTQMNMRFYKDGTVDYTATFFALVRTGLKVYTDEANLKTNDQAFKKMMKETWPNISKRTLDMVIPRIPKHSKHMTIAKVYTAKLIWENYKNMKKSSQRRKSSANPATLLGEKEATSEAVAPPPVAAPPKEEKPSPPVVEPKSKSKPAVPINAEDAAKAIQNGRDPLLILDETGEDWC